MATEILDQNDKDLVVRSIRVLEGGMDQSSLVGIRTKISQAEQAISRLDAEVRIRPKDGLGFPPLLSTTTNAISTGSKTFVVDADYDVVAYDIGSRVRVVDTAAPTTNWMEGAITAYTGLNVTVAVDLVRGSGTKTSWKILLAGEIGTDGEDGTDGYSVFTAMIYRQIASAIAPSGGTYNFGTGAITPPASWSADIPEASTTPTWVGRYSFQTAVPGATVTAGTWTIQKLVQSGSNGTSGTNVEYRYKKNTDPATGPTFTAAADNPGTGWNAAPNTLAAGEYDWEIESVWRAGVRQTNWTGLTRKTGIQGPPGNPGADAYTIKLTKEACLIACDKDGVALAGELGSGGKATADISVKKGTTALNAVTGTPVANQFRIVAGTHSNCTATIVDADTVRLDSVSQDTGYAAFTIQLEGTAVTFPLVWGFAKAKTGATGNPGPRGATGPLLGIKQNYSAYSSVNNGECYLHGYNEDGTPADVNGKITYQGIVYTVNKAMLNPNLAGNFFIAFNPSNGATCSCFYDLATNTFKTPPSSSGEGVAANTTLAEATYCVIGKMWFPDSDTNPGTGSLYQQGIAFNEIRRTMFAELFFSANSASQANLDTMLSNLGITMFEKVAIRQAFIDSLLGNDAFFNTIAAGKIHGNKITSNTIDTLQLKALSVTANEIAGATITGAKIAGGTIEAGNIKAGAITVDRLSVISKYLINDPEVSGNAFGWGNLGEAGGGSSSIVSYDAAEKAVKLTASGNSSVRPMAWKVDHNKIYKVTGMIKKSQALGLMYVGAAAVSSDAGYESPTASGNGGSVLDVAFTDDRTETNSTNQYSLSGIAGTTSWVPFVFYVVGANRNCSDFPGDSTHISVKLYSSTTHYSVRFLNWWNSTTVASLFIKCSVTEFGGGLIVASNIKAGAITAAKIATGVITADHLSSNSIFSKSYEMSSNGAIWAGSSAFGNANGMFLGKDGGAWKFSLGDKLQWNGTKLSISGDSEFSGSLVASGGVFGGIRSEVHWHEDKHNGGVTKVFLSNVLHTVVASWLSSVGLLSGVKYGCYGMYGIYSLVGIKYDASALYIYSAYNGAYFYTIINNNIEIMQTLGIIAIYDELEVRCNIEPSEHLRGAIDIGSSGRKFKDIHISGVFYAPMASLTNLIATNQVDCSALVVDTIGLGTLIEPGLNNTVDIGTSSFKFRNAYFSGNVFANTVDAGNVTSYEISATPDKKAVARTNNVANASTSYVKKREHIVAATGIYLVEFNLKSSSGYTAYARIYVNGIAVGTEVSTTSTTYVIYYQNISLTKGDLLQLYTRRSNAGSITDINNVFNATGYVAAAAATTIL